MIHNLNGSGRRILTYPAVYSCDTIAPSTLLDSLITLAHSVCGFRSKFFATNKRNALETFRQIENVLIFLEGIRNGSSDLPESVVLSLSELQLSFQKLLYLLEDCSARDGARLWMLMKSDRVANQFRVLIRAISTGLDVFPTGSVDVSGEVKELVEFIARQARKARFEVDPDDSRAKNDVIRILDMFKNRVDPDKREVKRVLDYIGIRKWRECNEEIKFLDGEIELEMSLKEENKRDLCLLSSLTSFMSYCRCVIFFDIVDSSGNEEGEAAAAANHHVRSTCNNSDDLLANADDLRCPISLETMKDPVTLLSTGHTYDRVSILKWFRAGNATCPNTGKKLTSTELVPNVVVKRIIQQYCGGGGGKRDVARNRSVVAGGLAAEGALKMVAGFLVAKLGNGTRGDKNKAAFEIRLLTKTSVFNRSCLVEAGAIPCLLNLLVMTDDGLAQETAIAALLNLSKHSKGKSLIVENGGLELVLYVLKKGVKIEARQHAAATLFYLASVEEYRRLIGENPEAIPALVELVKEGNGRCIKNAVVAIFGLLLHSGNRWRVLESGVVPVLVDLLTSSDREDVVTDSLAILATLAEKPDGTNAIIRPGALNTIVGILDSSTSMAGKEYCVSLLLALCINGGANVVALLVKNPPLIGSLYSLISEGTSRASKKATALIKLLHEFYERRSSGLLASVLPQERFIRVW